MRSQKASRWHGGTEVRYAITSKCVDWNTRSERSFAVPVHDPKVRQRCFTEAPTGGANSVALVSASRPEEPQPSLAPATPRRERLAREVLDIGRPDAAYFGRA